MILHPFHPTVLVYLHTDVKKLILIAPTCVLL